MKDSCERLKMPVFPVEKFVEAVEKVVAANADFVPPYGSGATLYLRPYMFGSNAVIGVKPATEYQFRIFATPVGPYFKGGVKPLTLRISDLDRAAPMGTGHIKAGLNYAMSLYNIVDAHDNGFDENMYTDSATHTFIEETGGANIIFITKDGKVVTPKSNTILPSITRRSLMVVAKEYLGLEVEERPVRVDELENFAECGLCGTAAVISPVGKVVDHGKVLDVADIPWAGRQLWDCEVARKDGKYYMYFPLKDRNDIFRLGVAISDKPEGPFIPQPDPVRGSYSIDYAVFEEDGEYYLYFGGLWGGQLQRYQDNKALESAYLPEGKEPALPSRVVRLSEDMLGFAEDPKPVVILDKDGNPLTADNPYRFFEASWMHKYNGKYYLSYSTGDTHYLCYAVGDNPYGPFTYQGVIMTPVVGWTTHHSIVEYKGKWYLFHHDSVPSGGKNHLRSLKVCELEYDEEGRIKTIDGIDE